MKKHSVRSTKSFRHGFVLNEQELRRMDDLVLQQMRKEGLENIGKSYSVIYKNGVVAHSNDLDDVLKEENSGSAKITSLSIQIIIPEDRSVLIEFWDLDSDNAQSNFSIKYEIRAKHRDWVFITSSLIEERIKKIKRFSLDDSPMRLNSSSFLGLLIPLILIGSVIPNFINLSNSETKLEKVKVDWKNGDLTDPIEAIIRLNNVENSLNTSTGFQYGLWFTVIILIIYLVYYLYFKKLFPVYNFIWGDYEDQFSKVESNRKTVNNVIILGLIISVVGGLIANYIGVIS